MLAVERGLIDLEVAGVHHHAGRGVDRQRHAVGHAVRDAQELDLEGADPDPLARTHGVEALPVLGGPIRELRTRRTPA